MENASKALIIAGAILLSILIISLGIVVVTNSRATIDKANVNQTEAETHNSKFEAYVGSGKTPTEVRQCLSTAFSYNGTKATNQQEITIMCLGSDITNSGMPSNIENGKTYTISVEYTNGYVSKITVTTP